MREDVQKDEPRMQDDESAGALGRIPDIILGSERWVTHLLLLYHFLLGSTRWWKPSLLDEVAAGPTAIVVWDDV